MSTTPTRVRTARSVRLAALLSAALLAPAGLARAQEAGHPPSPEELRQKVLEIERLMKQAEVSLARSIDTRSARERSEAAEKLLDERARKLAAAGAEGSREAAETLRKLTDEVRRAAGEASRQGGEAAEGVRKLLEETHGEGQRAAREMQWILDNAVSQRSEGGGGRPKSEKKPDKAEEKPDKPRDTTEEPPSADPREKPRTPEFEHWYAELPEQVRKAYDSQDWDSVPPRWRTLLRAWTKRMADDLEQGR
jgi:hypothetical protein